MDRWCAATTRARREVMPISTLWELAKTWYDTRMSRDYRGRTAADAQAIFRRFGLTSEFWQFTGDQDAPQK